MDKKTRKAALKLKKEEIKELKVKKQTFSAQLKDAKKSMVGIICMTYLKKAKKETAKVALPFPSSGNPDKILLPCSQV